MNQSRGYLRELLSNYTDRSHECRELYHKITDDLSEGDNAFVSRLTEQEAAFLNSILPPEIQHAKEELDYKRANKLNEIYELLT